MSEQEKNVKIPAEQYLMREGEESTEMYFLTKGQLAVYKVQNSQEVKIGDIFQGEIVGEMSFLDKAPRSASVKAVVDCELVIIKSEIMESVHNLQPKWYRAFVNTLLDRLRRANSRIKVKQRLVFKLLHYSTQTYWRDP